MPSCCCCCCSVPSVFVPVILSFRIQWDLCFPKRHFFGFDYSLCVSNDFRVRHLEPTHNLITISSPPHLTHTPHHQSSSSKSFAHFSTNKTVHLITPEIPTAGDAFAKIFWIWNFFFYVVQLLLWDFLCQKIQFTKFCNKSKPKLNPKPQQKKKNILKTTDQTTN